MKGTLLDLVSKDAVAPESQRLCAWGASFKGIKPLLRSLLLYSNM